jgi:hypothetical protein
MKAVRSMLLFFLLWTTAAWAQVQVTVQPGQALSIKLDRKITMRIGEPVTGVLDDPVYVADQLAIAPGCLVSGHISELYDAPRAKRVKSMLAGDFTPFHGAVIEFDSILLHDGRTIAIRTRPTFGIDRAREVMAGEKKRARMDAPETLERTGDLLQAKLPYHGQHIEKGTAYNAELAEPITVVAQPQGAMPPPDQLLSVRLLTKVDSQTARPNTPVEAMVMAPFYTPDGKLLFPQGTRVTGRVIQSEPAAKFQHQSYIRFFFHSAQVPGSALVPIAGTLASIETSRSDRVKMDEEGGLKPTPSRVAQAVGISTVISPARSAADPSLEKTGMQRATAGFGLIGGIAAQASPTTATAIAAYRAANGIYFTFFAPGKNLELPADTPLQLKLDRIAGYP